MARIVFIALWMSAAAFLYADCTVTTDDLIANKIAYGHAWTNHADEFSEKKRIANKEMPDGYKITTEVDFQTHIFSIMTSNAPKYIPGNRKVYWDEKTGTIVFYDPNSNDCGTAFRPNDGKEYYERVLKRKEADKDRSKMNAQVKHDQNYQAQRTVFTIKEDSGFRCDGRMHCSQMKSCAEATFFLNNCPNTKMDGNNDGIPCEKQWCN